MNRSLAHFHFPFLQRITVQSSGLLINQKMVGGRESCAAKATFAP
ncbi:hypothetical protein JOD24_000158 [Kroppenstedtia sanguinis]